MDPVTSTYTRLLKARRSRTVAGAVLILTVPCMLLAAARDLGPHVMGIGWACSAVLMMLTPLLPAPRHNLAQAAARLATWSLRLPLVGLSLMAPLTIHGLFILLLGEMNIAEFSDWMLISALVVGQAHLALVWLAWHRGTHMAQEREPLPWKATAWELLWKITLAACIPSGLLMMVPPLLTFMTGAVFVPAMIWLAINISSQERTAEDWLTMAERLRLQASTEPYPYLPLLTGTVDGIRVELSGETLTDSTRFELQVAMTNPALQHLHISTSAADTSDLKIGEPVADAVLHISSSGSQDVTPLTERMQDPECYAALMEVVHGQGGTLSRGRIRLSLRTKDLTAVWEALPKMLELARLLQAPPIIEQDAEALSPARQRVGQSSPEG